LSVAPGGGGGFAKPHNGHGQPLEEFLVEEEEGVGERIEEEEGEEDGTMGDAELEVVVVVVLVDEEAR